MIKDQTAIHQPGSGRTIGVPSAQVDRWVARGWVPGPAPTPDADGDGDSSSPPSSNAPKADWIEHAVTAGWERNDAEAKTKAELVATLS